MKSYLKLFFLFALLLSSCSEDDLVKNQLVSADSLKFIASFEENESRTYIEEGKLLRWTEGDQISLFVGNTLNQQYLFDGETGDNSGTFTRINGTFGTGNDLSANYAVYPYSSKFKITEEGIITSILPSEQSYAVNSFGLGANTMVAVTQDTYDTFLKFRNVCGYLKLQLYGDNVTVKSITLTGNNNEKLAGKATITPVYGNEPTISMADDATESITLNCGENGVKIGSTSASATAFWLVVPPTTFESGFTISITDMGGNELTKSTSNKVVIERNVIKPMSAFEVKIQNVDIPYVTFTAIENQTLTMSNPVKTLEYSLDGKTWNELSTKTVEFGGTKGPLSLRGKSVTGTATSETEFARIIFGTNAKVSCYGDIRTLIDYENFLETNTSKAKFCSLFSGCRNLVSAPDLPSTVLSDWCYASMFEGCISLDAAPALPATNLSDYCYAWMFSYCESLVTAPVLPATKLSSHCYDSMFLCCYNLINAPNLPATALADWCYALMFQECYNLVSAPILPAMELAEYCYAWMFYWCENLSSVTMLATDISAPCCLDDWLNGVSSTGTLIKATEMEDLPEGDSGIPTGWTVINYGENNKILTVTLTEAGTLGKYLTDANKNIVEELKIIGDINGTDIQLIRDITKVSLAGVPTEDTAALIKLDLSEANIVAGGNPYKAIRPDEEISTQNNVVTPGMFGYTNLKTIVLPNNIKEIGESAFEALLNMESFTIPTSVTKIGDKAFNTCQNLSSVLMSTNVISIGSHAFYDCKSLTEITIPNNVSTIGSYAFGLCTSLSKVFCQSLVPPTLSTNSFQLCNALQAIYVPSSVINKYKENAVWKQYNIVAE